MSLRRIVSPVVLLLIVSFPVGALHLQSASATTYGIWDLEIMVDSLQITQKAEDFLGGANVYFCIAVCEYTGYLNIGVANIYHTYVIGKDEVWVQETRGSPIAMRAGEVYSSPSFHFQVETSPNKHVAFILEILKTGWLVDTGLFNIPYGAPFHTQWFLKAVIGGSFGWYCFDDTNIHDYNLADYSNEYLASLNVGFRWSHKGTSPPPVPGSFSGSNFKVLAQGNYIQASLDYNNEYSEEVKVVYFFSDSGGRRADAQTDVASKNYIGHSSVKSKYLDPGKYGVSWTAYLYSDTGLTNPIAGSATQKQVSIEEEEKYTVYASASPSDGGYVSGGGTYEDGSTCQLTAHANNGYNFQQWGGSISGTSNPIGFTVTNNMNVVAYFTKVEVTTTSLTVYVRDADTHLSLSGASVYISGQYVGTTSGDGSLTTQVKKDYNLIVGAEASGYKSARAAIAVNTYNENSATVYLNPVEESPSSIQVSIVARDSSTERAIRDAAIFVDGANQGSGGGSPVVVTLQIGKTYYFGAEADGYEANRYAKQVQITDGTRLVEVYLKQKETAQKTVRADIYVRDSSTKNLIQGATVYVNGYGQGETGSDGCVVCWLTKGETLSVGASASGYVTNKNYKSVTISEDRAYSINIYLDKVSSKPPEETTSLQVQIWSDKSSYSIDETITVRWKANLDCYETVTLYRPDGSTEIISRGDIKGNQIYYNSGHADTPGQRTVKIVAQAGGKTVTETCTFMVTGSSSGDTTRLDVDVWTDKSSYVVGESITIRFKATKDCYATVTLYRPDGSSVIVSRENIKGNQVYYNQGSADNPGQRTVTMVAQSGDQKATDTCTFTVTGGSSESTVRLQVQIWTDKSMYSLGESITIHFKANKDCQDTVRVYRPDGSSVMAAQGNMKANQEYYCQGHGDTSGTRTVKIVVQAGSETATATCTFTVTG